MIKDLTDTFRKGILNSADYNFKNIQFKLETLPYIWCMENSDTYENWYYIGRTGRKLLKENYGFLSVYFPVALLMENCPDNVRNLLKDNNIFIDDFSRKCSCDEEILKKYAPELYPPIIDDRKLLDGRISFDSDEFIRICSFSYLSPYDFDFYDII